MEGDSLIDRLAAVVIRLKWFFIGLEPWVLPTLAVLAAAVAVGVVVRRRRIGDNGERRSFRIDGRRDLGERRFPVFQNRGEVEVSRLLLSQFRPPDFHLMNHVTVRMDDGTTQVDHILVSRFGVYVIETKHSNGWIFGNATDATWTHSYFGRRFMRQNPIHQNYRHVCAVRDILEFLPHEAIRSVVVFTGNVQFKTAIPSGVTTIDRLVSYLRHDMRPVMSLDHVQFCVGRLETARLAISGETDVEHVENLARRFGTASRNNA